ncbi:hypothetical protein [Streptomyces sp. NPDC020742]|uniref:hypothetical protein n=1 Tax=Streptomyces sp. NPDC020742 TaxID=3154897 RepID=UPI003406AEB4
MSAHQHDPRETPPTMNELLAACAAASAVSTPPDADEESRTDRPSGRREEADAEARSAGPSTGDRDAA